MDNFDLLNKKQLSYILNNKDEFGSQFISQVEDYCNRNEFSINEIKGKTPNWEEQGSRLILDVKDDEILLSKTEDAKRDEKNKYTFGLIAVGLILVFGIWEVFRNKDFDFDFWYALIMFPFAFTLFYWMVRKRKEAKVKSHQKRKIKILKSSEVEVFENGIKLQKDQIKAVNYFWMEDSEAGSLPNAVLELKTGNRKAILIDEEGNYLELMRSGNEIAVFLNKKLNIFSGSSPVKDKIEL